MCVSDTQTAYFSPSALTNEAHIRVSQKRISERFRGKVYRYKVAKNMILPTGKSMESSFS